MVAKRKEGVRSASGFSAWTVMICAAAGVLLFPVSGKAQASGSATQVAGSLVKAFDKVFSGPHAGYRAIHAKGLLVEGVFHPDPAAKAVSRAPHLNGGDVPVLVRFSDFAGVPNIADNDAAANPRGMAIKFDLGDGASTDIVAHSFNGFPAATPEEFLQFLTALGTGPDAFAAHVASHPAAKRFVDWPKQAPESYATIPFFGVNAFKFTDVSGATRFGRYRIEPIGGTHVLTAEQAASEKPNYLFAELASRLQKGSARFALNLQLPRDGDSLVDGSLPWPDDRPLVRLGVLELTTLSPEQEETQRQILFTPLSLVDGIAPSSDPMLVSRTRAYRISHNRRVDDGDAPRTPTQ